jgi:hypothetical protein
MADYGSALNTDAAVFIYPKGCFQTRPESSGQGRWAAGGQAWA